MITLEEIKKELAEEQASRSKDYIKDPGYEMCKSYVSSNRMTKAEHLMEIDVWECFKCLVYLKSGKKLSVEECEKITAAAKKIFGDLDYESYVRIIDFLFILTDISEKQKDQVMAYLNEPNKIKAKARLAAISEKEANISYITDGDYEDEDFKKILKEIKGLGVDSEDINIVIEYIKSDSQTVSGIFSLIEGRKAMVMEHAALEETLKDVPFLSGKERRRLQSDAIRKGFSELSIISKQNLIKTFVYEEEKQEAEIEKDNKRLVRIYQKTIDLLDAAEEKEEITNPREIVRYVFGEDLKRKILTWIYERNERYYNSLNEKLKELSAVSINLYIAVLSRFKISAHPKEVQEIMHNSPEDVEEILKSIPFGIYTEEETLRVLQTTTLEIALKIKKYSENGIIGRGIAIENKDIYDRNCDKLEKLEVSIEKINALGINPKMFCEKTYILWENPEMLEKNLMALTEYNLTKSLKTTDDYVFLLQGDLREKIDRYTELGFYSYLEEDISLLEIPLERMKRLELLRVMNIPVDDIETLYDVLESSKFIISDEDLDSYILDFASLKDKSELKITPEDLESMSSDKISLEIEGIYFSLPKVKRRLAEGDTVGEALFYHKKCSEEEYERVQKGLKPYIKVIE